MSAYGNAAVAQSVERRLGKAEVTGSIPVISLRKPLIFQGFFFSVLHMKKAPDSGAFCYSVGCVV